MIIDWSDAFENSAYIPGADQLHKRRADNAAAFRAMYPNTLDLRYGPGARERFDLYEPDGPVQGLLIFVHGGYWQMSDRKDWSHLAAGPLWHNWAVAMPSYPLAPDASLAEIVSATTRAVETIAAQIQGPVCLAGHSAGGHLVACLAAKNILPGRLNQVTSISGVHDLRPLTETKMNATLGLTLETARAISPTFLAPPTVPFTAYVGTNERPEFLRQTRLLAEAWTRAGAQVKTVYEDGHDHFSIVEALAQPNAPLTLSCLASRS